MSTTILNGFVIPSSGLVVTGAQVTGDVPIATSTPNQAQWETDVTDPIASLTGAGIAATPGDLTQAGGFAVNTQAASALGISLVSNDPQGVIIEANDTSGGGVAIDSTVGVVINGGANFAGFSAETFATTLSYSNNSLAISAGISWLDQGSATTSSVSLQGTALTSGDLIDGIAPGTGFTGNLLNLFVGADSKFAVSATGACTIGPATAVGHAPQLQQMTAYKTITSGALPTIGSWVSGTAKQNPVNRRIALYMPVTMTPTAGAAASCTVAISPDNVTYSTLYVETVPLGTALDSFVHGHHIELPEGWYAKFTVSNATLGTATYT